MSSSKKNTTEIYTDLSTMSDMSTRTSSTNKSTRSDASKQSSTSTMSTSSGGSTTSSFDQHKQNLAKELLMFRCGAASAALFQQQ
ncbi:hypothetical protein AAVH_36584, partial [Aphelenchoides avenae]